MVIKFKKLSDTAIIPTQAYETDAGLDLCANENVTVPAGKSATIGTGIAWDGNGCEFDTNSWEFYRLNTAYLIIQSRSGMAIKKGIECSNAGVIDQSYTGEIKIKLYNTTEEDFEVKTGDKIAQAIFGFKPRLVIKEVTEIKETDRAEKGFGSSGF